MPFPLIPVVAAIAGAAVVPTVQTLNRKRLKRRRTQQTAVTTEMEKVIQNSIDSFFKTEIEHNEAFAHAVPKTPTTPQ